MRRLLLIFALVLSCLGLAQGHNLDGVWEGEIQDPKRPIVVNVDFKTLRISFSGTAPSNMTRPTVSSDERTVKFEVINGAQTFKFAGKRDGARITGEMDTGTKTTPFWLERLAFLPKPANQGEAWRQDIDVVLSRFYRYDRSFSAPRPDLLFGADVLPNPDRLPLTVNCDGWTRRVELAPLPLKRSSTPVEAWWDLAPSYRSPNAEFKSALAADKTPLYLQHPERNYWVEYLDAPTIVYVQYNRAQEMSSESMEDFLRRVTRLLDEHQVKGFIVDVRFNTGGDAGVGTPLVEAFAPRLRNVPVVVLTGRATF